MLWTSRNFPYGYAECQSLVVMLLPCLMDTIVIPYDLLILHWKVNSLFIHQAISHRIIDENNLDIDETTAAELLKHADLRKCTFEILKKGAKGFVPKCFLPKSISLNLFPGLKAEFRQTIIL